MKSIERMLDEARSRLDRLHPPEAAELLSQGALLVDIRPQSLRAAEGEIPGSIIIERNILEWRLDPQAETCIDEISDHDHPVLVICSEGYTSSLAAASLRDLGLTHATDVIGGYRAWKAEGLPTRPGGSPSIA